MAALHMLVGLLIKRVVIKRICSRIKVGRVAQRPCSAPAVSIACLVLLPAAGHCGYHCIW